MGRTLLLVTSTNNRAVDNVLDPLARELPETALPLGLRAGNLEVTASLTAETLARARAWLRAQDPTDAAARHAAALAEFAGALEEVDQALAPSRSGRRSAPAGSGSSAGSPIWMRIWPGRRARWTRPRRPRRGSRRCGGCSWIWSRSSRSGPRRRRRGPWASGSARWWRRTPSRRRSRPWGPSSSPRDPLPAHLRRGRRRGRDPRRLGGRRRRRPGGRRHRS
ncbi:MAG: hypothetical protein R3F60_01325 [bacterium]